MIKNHYVETYTLSTDVFPFFPANFATNSRSPPQALAAKKSPVIYIFIRALDDR